MWSKFIQLVVCALLLASWLGPAQAQQTDNLESLNSQLTALESQLPQVVAEGVAIEQQQAFVNEVLELRARILALEWQSENSAAGSADEQRTGNTEHTLLLASATTATPANGTSKGNTRVEFSVSQEPPGLSMRRETSSQGYGGIQKSSKEQRSTGFSDYPISIRLGEPFSYSVSLRAEREINNRYCLGIEHLNQTALTHVGRADMLRGQMMRVPYPVVDKIEFQCEQIPGGHYPLLASTHLSGEHDLQIQCQPATERKETDYLFDYPYQCRYQSTVWGQSDYYPPFSIVWPKVEMQENGHFLGENNIEWNAQLVVLNGFGSVRGPNDVQESVLRYMPKFAVRKELQASSYEHPFPLREPWQHPEQLAQDDASEQLAQENENEQASDAAASSQQAGSDRNSADSSTGLASSTEGSNDNAMAAPDFNNPAAVDPDSTQISGFIRQWISTAEPAVNVQHGHKFKFEKWGRLVGTNVDGGKVSVRQKPDDVGIQSDSAYLWAKRTQLLSANHCSLEEFVMKSLQSNSMADCQGRYGPIVPDFAGQSLSQAKARLAALKLTLQQAPGDVAPSKELSMTVQQQQVAAGTELTAGQAVELKLYLPYIEQVKVPSLIGEPSGDAQDSLKKLGLMSKVQLGAAAPTQKLAGRVVSQSLQAGAQTQKGTMLLLTVHGPYAANKKIPSVVGMPLAKAKQIIEFAGYAVNLKLGKKTDSADLINTIERQVPPAGVTLKKGSKVALYSYASNAQQAQVGNYLGLNVSAAQAQVAGDGLAASLAKLEDPPDRASAGKVFKQTPPAGIKIKAGGRVTLRAYGDYLLTVGDYRQLVASDIAAKLRADGLRVDIRQGQPAPSPRMQGLVVEQQPSRGAKVKAGATIALVAYAKHIAQAQVPSVIGLSAARARQQLAALGLVARIETGSAAPSTQLANRVSSVYPPAGQRLAAGSDVVVSVYGSYQEARPTGGRVQGTTLAAGSNSLSGDWQGKLTAIDKDTGEVFRVLELQFSIAPTGALNGRLDLQQQGSARLEGSANGQRVSYIGYNSSSVNGKTYKHEFRFSGQGSGDRITGLVEYEIPDVDCVIGSAFSQLDFNPYNYESKSKPRAQAECPDVTETQKWQATRSGAAAQVNRQQLEEEIYRAQLFRELLISKQQIDTPRMCGGQRAEAARTKRELVALNQRFQGQATAQYRSQAEALKQANKTALNQYYACFANNLRGYALVSQAGINDYRQHSQAYADLAREFGGVADIDQFIQARQQQL